jgi:hypothetical protein
MALAPFFDRIYGAVGMHLSVSRKSLSTKLRSTMVGIKCGPNLTANERFIAELTTNLTARLYPTLSITGQDRDVKRWKQLAVDINPRIEFAPHAPGKTCICVGSISTPGAIYPSASGWAARVGHGGPMNGGPENPYSAGAAAALACSELFRRVFLHGDAERDLSISLLDFGSDAGRDLDLIPESIGEVLFVGLGAVGNAAIWALARDKKTRGTLSLVDDEVITLSNLQRYVLAKFEDVSKVKVELAAKVMRNSSLDTLAYQSTLEDFTPPLGWIQPPTTCISVDNVNGRRVAQALLPKLVINGWTGEGALGASWHEFGRDAACLACLYQPHGQDLSATQQAARALGLSEERATLLWVTRKPLSEEELMAAATALGVKVSVLKPWKEKPLGELYTDVVCGAVPLNIGAAGRVEVVPLAHQSVLAGILMAAELLKRSQPALASLAQSESLISWDDVLRPAPKNWKKPRPRENGCICGDTVYQSVYRSKWQHGD